MRAKTVRHRVDFHGLVSDLETAGAWDTLRTQGPTPFRFPATHDAYVEYARAAGSIARRALAIRPLITLPAVSYGAGTGLLEWYLTQVGVPVTATEYGPESVEKLAAIAGLPAVHHDLLNDQPLPAATHIMHRVDAQFTRRQWRSILARYGRVLFIPGAMTDNQGLREERKRKGVPAGWLRNERATTKLWSRTHTARRVDAHDLPAWLLERC